MGNILCEFDQVNFSSLSTNNKVESRLHGKHAGVKASDAVVLIFFHNLDVLVMIYQAFLNILTFSVELFAAMV